MEQQEASAPILFSDAKDLSAALEKQLGVVVNEDQLAKYATLILQTNEKFNITAHKSLQSIYTSLFYEALVPYEKKDFSGNKKVLDIGPGSGVPGLLLKLAFPKIQITMIEASNKKAAFIQKAAVILGLTGVKVICSRAEIVDPIFREQFDIATARALASLPVMLELLVPYVKVGGKVICPKSKKYWEEITQSKNAISRLGLSAPLVKSFHSLTSVEHNVACFVKKTTTPIEFPRSWAQIQTHPL